MHGGAWRDPAQSSECFLPTLNRLLITHIGSPPHSKFIDHIAGIASINYRLSPYTSHPTDPSLPTDRSRNAKHPDHINDVRLALNWLRTNYAVGGPPPPDASYGTVKTDSPTVGTLKSAGYYDWIGIGHSCGATLLLQYVSHVGLGIEIPSLEYTPRFLGPKALILLEGIYSIRGLLDNHSPPKWAGPPKFTQIYADFLSAAFGPLSKDWDCASPNLLDYTEEAWPQGKLIVLCHSDDDELVEWEQVLYMVDKLQDCGWLVTQPDGTGLRRVGDGEYDEERASAQGKATLGERNVIVRKLKGGHDEIWEDGREIARVISGCIFEHMAQDPYE